MEKPAISRCVLLTTKALKTVVRGLQHKEQNSYCQTLERLEVLTFCSVFLFLNISTEIGFRVVITISFSVGGCCETDSPT